MALGMCGEWSGDVLGWVWEGGEGVEKCNKNKCLGVFSHVGSIKIRGLGILPEK